MLNELQAAIGRWLRAEYDPGQPMPQQLVDLLIQLEQRDDKLQEYANGIAIGSPPFTYARESFENAA
jgi:hypothetical protein